MSRSGKEFSDQVIDYAYRKSGGCCERCGSPEQIEVHHILPIAIAADYFPQLASWVLKSAENAQCLCHDCHTKAHRSNEWDIYNGQALTLLHAMGLEYF